MSLSKDLISQFVKATKDATTVKKESTVYGTVVKYNEKTYVKIDGSDLLTPAETLSSVEEGERVSIMIKDHTATITGNYTAPSASSIKVDGMDADLKANTANIKNLIVKNAEIENLVASKATIEDLRAANAEIDTLKSNYAEIETLVAEKASIGDLEAVNADIKSLKADKADIKHLEANYATIGSLNAVYADITRLEADKADINELEANYATIISLNATNANITNLTSQVADINTLINGNLTSDNIQSLNLTAANTTIENAMIKNAMIDSVSANKVNTGTLNTNNVSIQSSDGSMLLQGNLQQFKDKNGKVRIQIGKDATGNFTFVLYDENGTGQLINQNGIQSSNAIADGLIVDAKVAENANIAGSKLDIDSVVTEVNNGSTSIKGTRIYLDGQKQSLDVAFNNMTTTVKGNTDTLNTHTTSINTMGGKVTQLISDTTITKQDGTTTSLKDAYNTTVDTVNSHSTKIGSLETNLSTANNNISSVSSKQAALEQNLDGFKQTVSNTYTTKADFDNLSIGGRNLVKNSNFAKGSLHWGTMHSVSDTILHNGHKSLRISMSGADNYTWSGATQTVLNDIQPNTTITMSCWYYVEDKSTFDSNFGFELKGKKEGGDVAFLGISVTPNEMENGVWKKLVATATTDCHWEYFYVFPWVAKNGTVYVTDIKVELGNKATDWTLAPEDIDDSITLVDNKFVNYSTTTQMNSAINQKANEITSSVSQTYATKTTLNTVDGKFANYSTTSQMNSAINQKANEITSTVSGTYAEKSELNSLKEELGDYTLLITSETIIARCDEKGNLIK